jgi:hypothetical protein
MNRRKSERIILEVPISVGDTIGTTRDISSNCIYFTSEASFQVGGVIRFSLSLDRVLPDRSLRIKCQGHVVRVEDLGEQNGVAATIDRYSYLH